MAEGPKNINYQGPPEEKAYWLRSAQQYMKRIEDGIGGHLLAMGLRSWERVIHGKGADGSKKHATIRGSHFIGSMGGITNITIDVGGGKKEPPPEEWIKKEIEEDRRTKWVLILGLTGTVGGTDCIGAMILKPTATGFSVMKYIKNEKDEARFLPLVNAEGPFVSSLDPYNGFKEKWYRSSPGLQATYEIKELPRLSQMWMMDSDYGADNDSDSDSGWDPGTDPVYWTTKLDHQPAAAAGGITYNVYVDDGYEVPIDATHKWVYVDSEYSPDCYGNFPRGADSRYNQASYIEDNGGWLIEGLSVGGPSSWESSYGFGASFTLINCYWERYYSRRVLLMGLWLYDGAEGWEGPEGVDDAFVWPSDGIQRRTESSSSYYDESFHFHNNQGGDGPIVVTQNLGYSQNYSSWVQGVWSFSSETDETYSYEEEKGYWNGDCVTLADPDFCLQPQETYAPFAKWIAMEEVYPGYDGGRNWNPCMYSSAYHYGGYADPPEYVPPQSDLRDENILFDDGHREVMETAVNYYDLNYTGEPNDLGIYDCRGETIRVGHYRYCFTNDGSGYPGDNIVFAYSSKNGEGKFRKSDKFRNAERWYADDTDAFECIAKYGGYWNGQVRVASLKVTTNRDGYKKAIDGTLKEHRDAELREIPR